VAEGNQEQAPACQAGGSQGQQGSRVQPFCPMSTEQQQPQKELVADCGRQQVRVPLGCTEGGTPAMSSPVSMGPRVSGSPATASSPVSCAGTNFDAAAGEPAWDAHLLTAALVEKVSVMLFNTNMHHTTFSVTWSPTNWITATKQAVAGRRNPLSIHKNSLH